jgi:hypothetical protein
MHDQWTREVAAAEEEPTIHDNQIDDQGGKPSVVSARLGGPLPPRSDWQRRAEHSTARPQGRLDADETELRRPLGPIYRSRGLIQLHERRQPPRSLPDRRFART